MDDNKAIIFVAGGESPLFSQFHPIFRDAAFKLASILLSKHKYIDSPTFTHEKKNL